MAYYLAVETTVSSFEGLNFKKSKKYQKLFGNQKGYESTLEEIDKFTTEYVDEQRLSNDLQNDSVLSSYYHNHPLSIIYVNGLEVRKVPGELLFLDSKKFIENPNLVIEYIINKAKEEDTLFFRKLSLILPENNVTTYMISVLATSFENKQIKGFKNKLSLLDKLKMFLNKKNDEELIQNIAKSLVQFCYLDNDGQLEFTETIDYEKFHHTVSFISEYERNLSKEKTDGPKRVKTKQNTRKK